MGVGGSGGGVGEVGGGGGNWWWGGGSGRVGTSGRGNKIPWGVRGGILPRKFSTLQEKECNDD